MAFVWGCVCGGLIISGNLSRPAAGSFKDAELLAFARVDADEILGGDPKLLKPEHALLKRRLLGLYQSRWNWIDLA